MKVYAQISTGIKKVAMTEAKKNFIVSVWSVIAQVSVMTYRDSRSTMVTIARICLIFFISAPYLFVFCSIIKDEEISVNLNLRLRQGCDILCLIVCFIYKRKVDI